MSEVVTHSGERNPTGWQPLFLSADFHEILEKKKKLGKLGLHLALHLVTALVSREPLHWDIQIYP